MLNRKQIRRALAHTTELVGTLTRTPKGWTFQTWHFRAQMWTARPTMPYNNTRRFRKALRLARAAYDLNMTPTQRATLQKLAATTARPDWAIAQALKA